MKNALHNGIDDKTASASAIAGDANGATYTGGTGNDTYTVPEIGYTTITDTGGADEIDFGSAYNGLARVYSRVDDSLRISFGGTEMVNIKNYFLDPKYRVESLHFADGSVVGLASVGLTVIGKEFSNDSLSGGDGDDIIDGLSWNDTLDGLGGNDRLYGSTGQDWLRGGAGSDTLYGGQGIDYLQGGDGDDWLDNGGGDDDYGSDAAAGGAGNDIYFVSVNDSFYNFLRITETEGEDTLLYKEGASEDQMKLSIGGAGGQTYLRISFSEVQDIEVVEITSQFSGGAVEWIEFNDGTRVDLANHQYISNGSDNHDDTLRGISSGGNPDDIINGLGGNDTLYGAGGNDTLDGGEGNDTLYGETDDDLLIGRAGKDKLYGDAGNDTLDGRSGETQMAGGAGDDVYMIGGGPDRIDETTGTGNDTVQLWAGSTALTVGLERVGYDLVLRNLDTGETLTIAGNFKFATPFGRIERIILDDGNDLDLAGHSFTTTGTFGDDILYGITAGGSLDDLLQGLESEDVLYGLAGNDTLDGGSGIDTASYGDTAFGVTVDLTQSGAETGEGRDVFISIENLNGSDYNDRLTGDSGANTLAGQAGNDTLDGGGGDDLLKGSAGNDLYIASSGQDWISETSGDDTVRLWAGATQANIGAERLGLDLVLHNLTTGDSLTLDDYFMTNGTPRLYEHILLDDNSRFSLAGYAFTTTGTSRNDTLWGITIDGDHDDLLQGLAGNDVLLGFGGNDTLDGGEGSDTADYSKATAGVTVDLTHSGNETGEGRDVFIGIENVAGSKFADTVAGDGNGNRLDGGLGDDTLYGAGGDDVLIGGAGNDRMYGGLGDDSYYVSDAGDGVFETIGEGIDTVISNVSYVLGANLENLSIATGYGVSATGNGLDNLIYGSNAHNTLDGAGGDDWLEGYRGDDTYIASAGHDVVLERAGEGTDTLRLWAGSTADTVIFRQSGEFLVITNILTGDAVSIGQYFHDLLPPGVEIIQDGNGQVIPFTPSFRQEGTAGDDTLTGDAGNTVRRDELLGLDGNDLLKGLGGDDTLDGGAGNDSYQGGAGNDTYIASAGQDVASEVGAGGTDTVRLWAGSTLASLTFTPVTFDNNLHAWRYDLVIGNNLTGDTLVLDDFFFPDTPRGGFDRVLLGDGSEIDFSQLSYVIAGGSGNDGVRDVYVVGGFDNTLLGLGGDDKLHGYQGNDTLDGGDGDDEMYGDSGDDLYVASSGHDLLSEGTYSVGYGGEDTIQLWSGSTLAGLTFERRTAPLADSLSLIIHNTATGDSLNVAEFFDNGIFPSEIEHTLTSDGVEIDWTSVAFYLDGTSKAERLYGNQSGVGSTRDMLRGLGGNDILYGLLGDDTLDGGDGIDTANYGGATAGVTVDLTQSGAETGDGRDVFISIENLLGSKFHDSLTGDGGDNGLNGGAGNDTLYGGNGDDDLDGAGGSDRMYGGAGNDSFHVGNVHDRVFENAGEGSDTVFSTVDFTLGDNLETLVLDGIANLVGRGNTANNALIGNAGNNFLNGGMGMDAMAGGAGDDTYVVDNAGDTVSEATGQGADVVWSSVSFTLGAQVEQLALTGSAAINAVGNSLANVLRGNSGNNRLDGRSGADIMAGGAGNDTYIVDDPGDVVREATGEGRDLVYSWYGFDSGNQYIDDIVLLGNAWINATGNVLSNILRGNGGDNVLRGLAGDDVLYGGLGHDTLIGGSGKDYFVFEPGSGEDIIQDFQRAGDVINLHAYAGGTAYGGGITIEQSGADTLIDLGSGNSVLVLNTTATDSGLLNRIIW